MSNQNDNYSSFNNATKNSVLPKSPPPPPANDSRIRTRFGGSSSHRNYAATTSASSSNSGHCCNGSKSASDLSGTPFTENVGRVIGKTPIIKARFYDPWNDFALGLFFDALKQFGKDFDQIHNYFQQKSKQQNAKNYAQIKTFYRRTWLKLSTKLNLPEDANIPKDAREIFGMIAYGELIKRAKNLKMTSPDFSLILSGIVFNGFTVVRIRAKINAKNAETNKNRTSTGAGKLPKKKIRIVRIKMPQCPALAKFFEKKIVISENHVLTKESTNMPKSVVLELVPKTYGDRAYVLTNCKQNPQIKFNLSLNQPISEILIWLKRKWLPEDQRTLLQCQVDQSPNTDEFCWPDIIIFPSNQIRLNPVSIYPLINENSSQSNVTTLYGLKQCFNLISGDESEENNRSTKTNSTVVNTTPNKTQIVDQEPVQTCVVQSDGTKLTFCPKIIQNGLSLENCGGLTAGQLCLTCFRSPVLRFVYTIKSKIRDMNTVSPTWQCFLRLIQHNFFELLNDTRPNLSQTTERYGTTAVSVAEETEPQQNVQTTEDNPSTASSSTHNFVENIEQQPIVASETQAFMMRYKKIREDVAVKQKKRCTTSIFRAPKTPVRRQPSSTIGENFAPPQTPPPTFQKVIAPRFTPSATVTATVVNIIPAASPGENCVATAIIPLESLTQPQQTAVFVQSAQNVEQNLQPRLQQQPIFHGPFSDIPNRNELDYQQQNELPVTSLIMTENGEISIQNNNILLTGEEMARDSFEAQRVTPNMHSNVHQSAQSIPLDLHDLSLQSNSSIFGFTLNTPLKKALLNQESTEIDEVDKPCSTKQLTLDFSMDSLKSGNSLMGLSSSADFHLQNDVKRSMQLMNEQNSVEFCRNFAQLADVLVTPKKSNEFETNHNYFN